MKKVKTSSNILPYKAACTAFILESYRLANAIAVDFVFDGLRFSPAEYLQWYDKSELCELSQKAIGLRDYYEAIALEWSKVNL